MIKKVTVVNHLNEKLELDLFDYSSSSLIVKSITGLGPVKANINLTDIALMDGSYDNSARKTNRNIVFTLVFEPDLTIEDTRQKTYKYFPVKQNITLYIETDNRTCMTTGRVESNEPVFFGQDRSGCSISVLCPDPYFYDKVGKDYVFSGVESVFEFPFENNSLEENLIEFGNYYLMTTADIYYNGDTSTGIVINLHALDTVTNVRIYNTGTREVMYLDTDKLEELTGYGFIAGDDIIINTNRGSKSITLVRGGVKTNILNIIGKDNDWFQLSKGDNIFTFIADSGSDQLLFKITVKDVYEGV